MNVLTLDLMTTPIRFNPVRGTMIPSQFQIELAPQAAADAIFLPTSTVRITILTDRLLRFEFDPTGRFEDRASQTFWHRQQPVPPYTVAELNGRWTIATDHLTCTYGPSDDNGFTAENLSVMLSDGRSWHFGDSDEGNLGGTFRTLDNLSGGAPFEPGLLSHDGWVLFDDSDTLVLNDDGWIVARQASAGAQDLYFFGYGHEYETCIRDFCRIAGQTPLIPRYMLGNWWSRYWQYTAAELKDVVSTFRDHDIPLAICIIDMDWHLTETGGYHSGWTGYTWNRDYFPDPDEMVRWLHEQGLRTALNLHPADGIAPHEEMYSEMARALGQDPAEQEPIPFQLSDPAFARAYFEILHHPQETRGIDFWWIDWQQGEVSELTGLDPLWQLNHLHFYDLGRNDHKRPVIFSRWARLGSHRYPIGFSGDSFTDWPSLAFQPTFTATAANVAYGWWSHDIGGHMSGQEEPELYLRWVQFGVFSPILRLHSTNNPFHERHPWGYDAETLRLTTAALQLRHALIPYIYSMAWRLMETTKPLIQPLYHAYPNQEEAYGCTQQYLFGSELMVAPYTTPADPDTTLSRQVVWFPEGSWYDFFTGEHIEGGRWQAIYGSLEHIPVYAKAGAIVPLDAAAGWGSLDNPTEIDLHIFAGADNTFILTEDDGISNAYRQGAVARTRFEQRWRPQTLEFAAHPTTGDRTIIPAERHLVLHVHGITYPDNVVATLNDQPLEVSYAYDYETEYLTLDSITIQNSDKLVISLSTTEPMLLSNRQRRADNVLTLIKAFRLPTIAKADLAEHYHQIVEEPEQLVAYQLTLTTSQQRALLETIYEAGVHEVNYGLPESTLIVWNTHENDDIYLRFTREDESYWQEGRFQGGYEVAPKSQVSRETIAPNNSRSQAGQARWQATISYANLASWSVGRTQ